MSSPVPPTPPGVPVADRFWADAEVVLEPEDPRPGSWAGGPSAQLVDGTWWLAYRLRRPVGEGRGFANVVARSDDGVRFTPVVALGKDAFGAESLERPALVRTPEGGWRLYVSCATPGTKHWRVDLLEAATVEDLATATPRTVLPGSDAAAVKDPVVRHDGAAVAPVGLGAPARRPRRDRPDDHRARHQPRRRHLEVAGHRAGRRAGQLGRPRGPVRHRRARRRPQLGALRRPGDRGGELGGARPVSPCATATAASPPVGDGPLLQSPHAPSGLRYADVVALPDGGARWFYEATRADGAHELRTVLLPD